MADELISSLKTISREINDRIKWHELGKKGILEEVGMTDPLKRPGGKTKRQQRIFKVADA